MGDIFTFSFEDLVEKLEELEYTVVAEMTDQVLEEYPTLDPMQVVDTIYELQASGLPTDPTGVAEWILLHEDGEEVN